MRGASRAWLAVLGLGALVAACAPAGNGGSPDGAATGSGGASVGTGGAGATGTGGATTAGGASGTGGASPGTGGASPGTGGASPGTGGAATGTGGSSVGNSGGSVGAGGATGSGGAATGSGGAGGTTGCNWVAPAGNVVLFDGTSMAEWKNARTGGASQWRLVGDGTMEVVPLEPPTDLQTKMKFEDLCLHLEYMTPTYPANVTGQQRGNSGIYLKSAYEMQILDSIGQPAAIDSCGAVYGVSIPLTVACNAELVWNTYEIEFRGSVWDTTGRKTKNAVIVLATLNGKVVQRNVDLNLSAGATTAGMPDAPGAQSLMLQDHRNLVRFRNIWIAPAQK